MPISSANSSRGIKLSDTPGPGTYKTPSDFGHLDLYKYTPRKA
jgi:hypothetical protein